MTDNIFPNEQNNAFVGRVSHGFGLYPLRKEIDRDDYKAALSACSGKWPYKV